MNTEILDKADSLGLNIIETKSFNRTMYKNLV